MNSNKITAAFPYLVSLAAALSLAYPSIFTWFQGPFITLGLGGIMLGMGLTLKLDDFIKVGKTPKWIVLGLLLQYTIMPLLGWVIAFLFELPPFLVLLRE